MRRIDIIWIGLGIFGGGGALYLVLKLVGLDDIQAGLSAQTVLTVGLLGWVVSYLYRVTTQKMTYNQQVKDYEDAVLQKRLDEMTPEQLAALQAELEAEKQQASRAGSGEE